MSPKRKTRVTEWAESIGAPGTQLRHLSLRLTSYNYVKAFLSCNLHMIILVSLTILLDHQNIAFLTEPNHTM